MKNNCIRITSFVVSFLLLSVTTAFTQPQLQMVPMRDGTRLATYIWIPEGQGPWPAVVIRTPYSAKDVMGGEISELFQNGYAIVAQDIRGRLLSEGKSLAFMADGWGDHLDGYDCIEWVAEQSWCNGRIGTWGRSGPGITQTLMAGAAPPSLDAQHIGLAAADLYSQSFFQGGQLRLSLVMNWLHRGGWDLPDHTALAVEKRTYGDFWRSYNINEPDVRPNAPMLNYSGWYDIYSQGAIDAFLAGQHRGGPKARGRQLLIMGPWPHGFAKDFGEARLPNNALTPPLTSPLGFFDYHLKGIQNEFAQASPVYYYTIGDIVNPESPLNRWRTADDWPVPCEYTPFYLHGDGTLQTGKPDNRGAPRSFMYNPDNPVPTLGGNNLFLDKGPFDNRELESRPDVLVYTGPVLQEDIEVTGRVRVILYVSSTAPDTDFTAKLCDVLPDGRSLNVLDGIIRMRFHRSFEKEHLLQPGRIYRVEIDLWSTSWIFKRGHQIRLAISSSNYPRFESNPNTGDILPLSVLLEDPSRPNPNRPTARARNTVFSDSLHSSHLLLPLIPARE